IFHGCGTLSQEEVTNIITSLIASEVLLERNSATQQESPSPFVEIVVPFKRHYPQMEMASFTLSPTLKDVPKTALKEVLFLSQYGRNIDFYRRLGFQKEPFAKNTETLSKRITTYHQFYNDVKQVSKKNAQFLKHLEKGEERIKATEILLTPEMRKEYDKKLIDQGIYISKKEVKKKKNSLIHYEEAVRLIEEQKLQQAMSSLQIALQIEPENLDYTALKERIIHINKQNAVKTLLLRLDKNETLMWDERILQKTLTQLFEINNYVATRMKVARILMKKEAYAVALEVLREANPTDKDTRNEITTLQKEIKKLYKTYKAQF
ncbi:hypothetical protein KAH37_03555, partial [bacterium]|nr:hypothetical protein [bacterium]